MVSTTLTAIAAGQPTSSSTNYHHHHPSSSATGVASSTANNNSNYQKAQQHQQQQQQQPPTPQLQHHSSTSSSVVATSTAGARNNYYSYDRHTANQTPPTNLSSNNERSDSDDGNRNSTHSYQQRPSSAIYERNSQSGKEETTTTGESNKHDQTTKIQRNEIVNLSQALLSNTTTPLNDQISLLFPKCRPKQHVTSNNNGNGNGNSNSKINSNNNSNIGETSTTESLNSNSTEDDSHNSVTASPIHRPPPKTDSYRSPPGKPATPNNYSRNYYRSVNIITQSPPPPSTSSVSSESLSSVAPRISTNPFLCSSDYTNGDDNVAQRLSEENEKSCHEELPVPTFRTFYYHTSTTNTNSNSNVNINNTNTNNSTVQIEQQKSRHQQRGPRILNDVDTNTGSNFNTNCNSNSNTNTSNDYIDEMPRKRNNYSGALHASQTSVPTHPYTAHLPQQAPMMLATENQHHQQHQHHQMQRQQQQQQQFHQHFNGTIGSKLASPVSGHASNIINSTNATTTPVTSTAAANAAAAAAAATNQHTTNQSNQNPFIRESYWEPAATTVTTTSTANSTTPTTTTATRHNLTPSGSVLNSPETETERELPPPVYGATSTSSRRTYHQQAFGGMTNQQTRLPRSPMNANVNEVYNESTKTKTTDHYADQALVNACTEGLTPLASHYLHGSRAMGNGASGGSVGGVGGVVVAGNSGNVGNNVIKERAREQDVRDIRDVGQLHHQQQQQQQHHQKQQQQQQHHQYQHHHQQQQQQPQQHRQQSHQTTRNMTEGRLSMISNGEVVVFDDITESWQNLKVTTDANAPRLSPGSQHGTMTPLASKLLQQNTLTVMDINGEPTELSTYKPEEPVITLREHKKYAEKSNVSAVLEARHGIIEYEGSPRRIGHAGNTPEEDRMPAPNTQTSNSRNTSSFNMSNNYNSNSPQQYPARPGFPQRIMSPPRENSTPNYGSNGKSQTQQQQHQQHYQIEQQLQQAPQPPPMLPQQQSPIHNNAEDTSNDVSEIGTLSDLTSPEVISAAAGLTATNAETNGATVTTPTAQISAITTTTGNTATSALTIPTKSSTFDYLYEFSETRKVLEEFFKCPSNDEKPIEDSSDIDSVDIQYEFHSNLERDDDDIGDAEEDDDDEDDEEQLDADNEDDLQMQNLNQQQQQQQQANYYSTQQQQPKQQQQQQQPTVQSLARYQYSQQQQPQQQQQQQQPRKLPQQQDQSQKNYNHSYANHRRRFTGSPLMRDFDFFLDSASRSSGEQIDQQDGINHNQQQDGRNNYRYSPETTDYDSNCGDLDSLSGDVNGVSTSCSNYAKYYASSMPVLEDGLSSGHTSDTENNNQNNFNNLQQQQSTGIHHTPIGGGISVLMDMKRVSTNNSLNSMNNMTASTTDGGGIGVGVTNSAEKFNSISPNMLHDGPQLRNLESPINSVIGHMGLLEDTPRETGRGNHLRDNQDRELLGQSPTSNSNNTVFKNIDPDLDALYSINVFHRSDMVQMTPPPPAPAPHRKPNITPTDQDHSQGMQYTDLRSSTTTTSSTPTTSIASAISSTLNRTRAPSQPNCLPLQQQSQLQSSNRQYQSQPPPIPERTLQHSPSPTMNSPVWLPRHLDNSANKGLLENSSGNHSKNHSADEEDIDTDLETDRLLGHQRLDDQGYYDENKTWERNKPRSLLSKISPKQQLPSTKTRNGYNALLSSTPEIPPPIPPKNTSNKLLDIGGSLSSSEEHSDKSPIKSIDVQDCVVTMGSPGGSNGSGCLKKEIETLNNGINANQNSNASNSSASGSCNESGSNVGSNHTSGEKKVKKSKNKEGGAVLIEGVLFRAKYLGSTQLVCEGQPTKSTRMMQAEEAVSRIKAPDSDVQPSTEVDLFISTEKIMVLNTDLKEIMMDHALRTISYIADIGDLVVLMARRRFVPQDIDDAPKPNRTPKMICHVFESDEAQFIAQSIGQAFQVAYMEFLKANGIEDHSFVKEMDYQEVLNSQEIFGDELEIFAKKELQKEVVVPKAKGEILGVVIVESGWGSMLPTVVIANLMSSGAAARCGQLNIGDQLIAINGLSLVGLPLSTCQNYIKNTKNQTVVKFTVVPCPPVVEVKIKRPNTKYQLGFSVQNGVICSLLRGGIAERGGVRVGHRIIEINNQSVVAVPHEKIVNLLATSVGEILMKTMPTSMFRLLTGQENPIYI